jgi:hypothetical protein
MSDTVRRVGYFYVQVDDKPGEATRILTRLKEAGVNLLNFTAFPVAGGRSQLDFIPEDGAAFIKTARAAGLDPSPRKECFLVRGADRAGAVVDLLGKLAAAGINVHAANATCGTGGGYGMVLWVKPEHMAPAAKALGVREPDGR